MQNGLVVVARVDRTREIIYVDKNGTRCVHMILPGMVVERIQGRELSYIGRDLNMVAQWLNDYR